MTGDREAATEDGGPVYEDIGRPELGQQVAADGGGRDDRSDAASLAPERQEDQ